LNRKYHIDRARKQAVCQGQNLKISYDVNNWMHGEVVSSSGTTLVVAVTVTNGIGTYASWTITVSGVQGAKGNDGASLQNLALLWL
jgi:hypothetical protein